MVKTVGLGLVGLLGLASVEGCAAHRDAAQTPAAVASAPNAGEREVAQFKRWLARENSWTQRQRLDRIEREWMPRLQTLPPEQRAEVAAAIQEAISSPRLGSQRERVVERVLTTDTQIATR